MTLLQFNYLQLSIQICHSINIFSYRVGFLRKICLTKKMKHGSFFFVPDSSFSELFLIFEMKIKFGWFIVKYISKFFFFQFLMITRQSRFASFLLILTALDQIRATNWLITMYRPIIWYCKYQTFHSSHRFFFLILAKSLMLVLLGAGITQLLTMKNPKIWIFLDSGSSGFFVFPLNTMLGIIKNWVS